MFHCDEAVTKWHMHRHRLQPFASYQWALVPKHAHHPTAPGSLHIEPAGIEHIEPQVWRYFYEILWIFHHPFQGGWESWWILSIPIMLAPGSIANVDNEDLIHHNVEFVSRKFFVSVCVCVRACVCVCLCVCLCLCMSLWEFLINCRQTSSILGSYDWSLVPEMLKSCLHWKIVNGQIT